MPAETLWLDREFGEHQAAYGFQACQGSYRHSEFGELNETIGLKGFVAANRMILDIARDS
jgi:hypothetical protein